MIFARDNFAADHGVFTKFNVLETAVFAYHNGYLQIDNSGAAGVAFDNVGLVENAPHVIDIGDTWLMEFAFRTYTNEGAASSNSTFMKIGLQLDKPTVTMEREYYGLYIESVPKLDNGGATSNPQAPLIVDRRYFVLINAQADNTLAVFLVPKGNPLHASFVGSIPGPFLGRSARMVVNLASKDVVRLYEFRGFDGLGF